MKAIRKLMDFKKWKALLVFALLCFSVQNAMAVYTVNVSINNSSYGSVTISGGTTVSATRHTYTSGQTCTVKVTLNSGYGLRYWYDTDNSVAKSYNATYSFQVTSNTGTLNIRAYVYPNWNGTQTSGTYVVNSDVTLSNTVTLTGNLTLAVNKTHQIKRGAFDGVMFYVGGGTTETEYKLTLRGHSGDTLYIDGGGTFNTQGTRTTGADARNGVKSNSRYGLIFNVNRGQIDFNTVVVQNGYNKCVSSNGYRNGCGFWVNGYKDDPLTFKLVNCVLRGLYSEAHAAGLHFSYTNHDGLVQNCRVYHNYAKAQGYTNSSGEISGNEGGILRCGGASGAEMTFNNCDIYGNTSMWNGGGIAWYGGYSGGKLIVKGNTKVHNNRAENGSGGGIHCGAVVDIQSADVYDNYAKYDGGGISIFTYAGPLRGYAGGGVRFNMTSSVKVHGNTASRRGGGVSVHMEASNYLGFDSDNNPISAANAKCIITIQDGAKLYNNASGQGGGIYVLDRLPYRFKNTESNKWSNELQREVNILGGDIYNNQSTDEIANVGTGGALGGAVFLYKTPNNNVSYSTSTSDARGAGSLYVNISGGNIYNNKSHRSTDGTAHGGAIAIYDDFTQYDSKCYVTIGGSVDVYDNQCDMDGGGMYIRSNKTSGNGVLSVTVNGGTIGKSGHPNKALGGNGGGIRVVGGGITVNGGHIDYNQALYSNNAGGYGGAFYLSGGTATVNGGTISYNKADKDGGGFYVNVSNNTDITTIKGGTVLSNNTAVNGAGAYVNKGQLVIQDAATNITSNTATTSGGGLYMANGTVTYTNAKMQSNTATNNDGGGLYLGNGTINISGASTAIQSNKAKNQGGGVYIGGGTFSMTGGTIGGTTSQGNSTTASAGYGGGVYMGDGTATLSGGSISGNKATGGYGGGVYMDGGTCELSNGATIGGTSATYANSAKFGGGIYSAGGKITVKGGKIQYNTAATAGGGIYTNGASGVVNVEKQTSKADVLSYIEYNTAQEGGGIYANRGVVNFSDGFIQYNYASEAGGGIYVNDNGDDDYGTLYLKGSANLRRNHVPEGHNGGGVYLKGKVVVGEQTANLGVIKAQENYAGDEYIYEWNDTGSPTDSIDQVTANNRNNIYLPNPGDTLVLTNHRDVITVIENGISLQSNVGFSVPHNYVPVIYCAPSATSQDYLDQFSTGHPYQYMVFDDTRHYVAVHYPDRPAIFDPDHVYLYGFWANVVTGHSNLECDITAADFEVQGDTIEISNACELAFFISWVNGLNGLDRHPGANAILLADIDMSKYGWVPIGDYEGGYSGTFDGNGHTVTGISSLLYREYLDYGFFGRLNGGTVKDLFVKGASYALDDMPNLVVGGLVGYINTESTVANCEASSRITVTNTGTVAGGLIGRMNAGTVHSTIGISDMSGYLMGGLVGELLGGNLYNSFSNCKFIKADPTHDKFMGGLVAVNRGTVENCYARRRGSVPKGKFGILVGDNTGGLVSCCYAPARETNYTVTGDSPTGHGNYGDTFLPYLYGHRDTQVTATNSYVSTVAGDDNQMMNVLNNWVKAKNGNTSTYTKWGRPWQESNDVKPLNDDFPILRMPMCEAVGAKKDDPYLYYNPVDSLLVRYTAADEAIWLYNNPADVVRGDNSASAAKLYIAEDVALINLNELKAYVGITLDNSAGTNGANPTYGNMLGITTDATDWHMISTSLSNAHIGIDYSTDNGSYDFSWGHPEGMHYYLFYPKGHERNGYFPSHRFGKSYPSSDATIEAGNYYQEWDFYSYSEPNYHWINFKRNSNSHHHFDTEQHDPITYTNEPTMTPGKGYFAATREETFLQCQGSLNYEGLEYELTQTPGVPRHGYNLIGNPYQAYLDFDAFAEANSEDVDAIWDDLSTASYTVLDEDAASYLTFAYDGSDNPDAAGRFIHPHQGFFVLLRDRNDATAYFYPEMRNTTAKNVSFRSNDHIDYPLVNLFVSEANGNSDMVTVELGRPEQGGATLMQGLRAGNGKIWCHYNDEDYAVAYTQPGITEAAIRFESVEDTEYTMRWNTHNGDFSYLHLIDNLTGADVDCLSASEYRFSASTSDYKSRFRLVFGYTGLEEDFEAEANTNFAFMMGDELVVTGEGVLQVFDMTGRLVASQELHGVQTMVSLPNVANGVYVLRLTEGNQNRIQKMVISK